MALITKKLRVDVAKKNLFPLLVAKQGDTGSRYLNVTLLNEGVSFKANPETKVTINARRPDGQSDEFTGSTNGDGTVTVPLDAWILQIAGIVTCDVSLAVGEDNRLTTMIFRVEVQSASYSGSDISQEE